MLANKEVLMVAQARNNRLYHLINEKWSLRGRPNVAEFCREVGVGVNIVGDLLNLRTDPFCEKGRYAGQYLPTAQKIAKRFEIPVKILFPLELYRSVVKSLTTAEVSLAKLPYVKQLIVEHAGDGTLDISRGALVPKIPGKITQGGDER